MPDTFGSIEFPRSSEELLADYRTALVLTNGLIDQGYDQEKNPIAIRARSESRMTRLRNLLEVLGNPHRNYRIVHVGGTSGKGSTSAMTASLLVAAGFSTGLHTSPYLQVATEKIQINGRLVDAHTFRQAVQEVIDAAESSGIGHVTYGEAWFAIVALIFAWEAVEVAVIEVGAGGRFDLTNVVAPDVSVITSVGFDHMETLGNTIAEIAWHKAGIIKPGIPVVCAVTDQDALAVIQSEAINQESAFIPVVAGKTFGTTRTPNGTYDWWESSEPGKIYSSSMPGRYQATNGATALTAVRALIAPETISEAAIRTGLAAASLPGRWEVVNARPEVILDGAHNPEKAAALARDLRARKRDRNESKVIVVLGVLESKDRSGVLRKILNVADELVATSPRVLAKPGSTAAALAADARALGFTGKVTEIDDSKLAIEVALNRAGSDDMVVVTGSLYLIGNVRGRWFPDDDIVIQRTSWPVDSTAKDAGPAIKKEIPD